MDALEIDPEQLLLKLNTKGSISEEELNAVVEALQLEDVHPTARNISVDDLYSMLLVVGRAKAVKHKLVLEKFLSSKDPLTVALVLDILCLQWKETAQYLQHVVTFALGASWDPDEDARITALKVLGEFSFDAMKAKGGKKETQKEVVSLLLSIFEDVDAETWTRQTAYYSLCRAFGKSWEHIPAECVQLSFDKDSEDIDWVMIAELAEFSQGSDSSGDSSDNSLTSSLPSSSSGSTTGTR